MSRFENPEFASSLPAGETYDVSAMQDFLKSLEENPERLETFRKIQEGRARDVVDRGELDHWVEQDQRLLYFGMGAGYVAQYLEQRTKANVFKLDIADLRTPDNKDRKFFIATARRLPVNPESCDVAMLSDVLHHCREQGEILNEATRILREDGKLILIEDTLPEAEEHLKRRAMEALTAKMDDLLNRQPKGVNPHGYRSKQEWITLAKKFDLDLEDEKHWYWGPVDFLPEKLKPSGGEEWSFGRPFECTRFVFSKHQNES